jgi:hypothetical protein
MKCNVQKSYDRGYIYMPRDAILAERIERRSKVERFAWVITFCCRKIQLAWKNLGKNSNFRDLLLLEIMFYIEIILLQSVIVIDRFLT